MFNVTLVNLAADARSVAALAHFEVREAGPDALRALLANFCEIDPIENAAAETEIRVQVRHESYLIRTEQKKLILYDARNRQLPGQIFTLAEVMGELDGTAAAARNQAIMQARAEAEPAGTAAVVAPVVAPVAAPNPARLAGLAVTAVCLLVAIVFTTAPFAADETPAGFTSVASAERAGLEAALTGVYLTGSEPGQHGIVVAGPGELKIFELGAVEAPRFVLAGYRLGRVDAKLCLATDQPGGLIEVRADGAMVYGGEVYLRIP